MEDVFQCSANHDWPIQPIVGESEKDFKNKEELYNFVVKIKSELESKYPYKNNTLRRKIYIKVNKTNGMETYYSLKELDNKNKLHDLVYN